MKRYFDGIYWENWLNNTLRKVSHEDFKDEWIWKVSKYTINFLSWFYKLSSSIIFVGTFVWFFPKVGITNEKLTIILLCLIILQLRFQKVSVKIE